VKKSLIKLSILSAFVMAAFLSSPPQSMAQSERVCPEGSFQCTCNGVRSCQTSISGCWGSC
jgi:hypothetical protein